MSIPLSKAFDSMFLTLWFDNVNWNEDGCKKALTEAPQKDYLKSILNATFTRDIDESEMDLRELCRVINFLIGTGLVLNMRANAYKELASALSRGENPKELFEQWEREIPQAKIHRIK